MHPKTTGVSLFLGLAMGLFAGAGWCEIRQDESAPRPDCLLSNKTTSLTWIPDPDQLDLSSDRTPYARLADDPVMRPFRREIEKKTGGLMDLERRTGVSYESLKSIASGWFASAQAPTPQNKLAFVALVDARAKQRMAREVLKRAGDDLVMRGAIKSQKTVGQTELLIYTMKKTPSNKQAGAGRRPARGASRGWQTVHFLNDGIVGLCESVAVAEDIVGNWSPQRKDCLANLSAYRQVMTECGATLSGGGSSKKPSGQTFLKNHQADVYWFLAPYEQSRYSYTPDPRVKSDHPSVTWPKHGFDAVKGVGGSVIFGVADCELFYQIAVYAPRPYRNAMKMLDFLPGQTFEPPAWLPADINSYSAGHLRLTSVIDNCAALFDGTVGEDIDGTFEKMLADMKSARGPGVDVRNDLIRYLGPKVMLISDNVEPVSANSERTLAAVEIQDEQKVAQAIKKLLRNDPNVQRLAPPGRHRNSLWKLSPNRRSRGGRRSRAQRRDGRNSTFSDAAMMVAHGHLLYATNIDLIRKLLSSRKTKILAHHEDYRRVSRKFAELKEAQLKEGGAPQHSLEMFARVNLEFYTTYELLRQNKLQDAESIYAMLVKQLITNVRRRNPSAESVDFRRLPQFAQIEKYLGPVGIIGKNWNDQGWLLTGFALKPSTGSR